MKNRAWEDFEGLEKGMGKEFHQKTEKEERRAVRGDMRWSEGWVKEKTETLPRSLYPHFSFTRM